MLFVRQAPLRGHSSRLRQLHSLPPLSSSVLLLRTFALWPLVIEAILFMQLWDTLTVFRLNSLCNEWPCGKSTVLGPLMSILYINDIGQHTSSNIRLFADDCLFYRVIHNACDALEFQKVLGQMCSWAKNWHMRFNASKCSILTITKKIPIKSTYTIEGQALEHPYLGVELSKKLSCDHQINQTVSKAQKTLNLLRRNITECSQMTKGRAYKALVRPILEYTRSVWDPFQASHISKLEAVQRKAARFVTGQHSRQASVSALLHDLQWRSPQERRFVSRLVLSNKALSGQAACDGPHYFPPHTPRTRCSHRAQFSLPHQHLDICKYSFFPRTIRVYNIIPEAAAQAPDTVSFKTMLQQQLSSLTAHLRLVLSINSEITHVYKHAAFFKLLSLWKWLGKTQNRTILPANNGLFYPNLWLRTVLYCTHAPCIGVTLPGHNASWEQLLPGPYCIDVDVDIDICIVTASRCHWRPSYITLFMDL